MTRGEMLARMDSREYAEWMAYDLLEPVGPFKDALLWVLLYNANRGKDAPAVTMQDYPFLYEPEPELSDEDLSDKIRRMFGCST